MKKTLILLILVSNVIFSQTSENYKQNLNRDFTTYNHLILTQEFEKAMYYMPLSFFEIIPKDQLIMVMKQVLNNPEIEFKFKMPENLDYGVPQKIEDQYYSEISYTNDIQMKFKNEEVGQKNTDLILLNLEKTFGPGNVRYNQETGFFEIHAIKKAIGISENGISDWKFIVIEKDQKSILEKILPKELIEN